MTERPKFRYPKGGKETQEPKVMPVGELIERLRPYPLLQSIVLRTMTDEEWEEYVLQNGNGD